MSETIRERTADARDRRRLAELEIYAEYIAHLVLQDWEPEVAMYVCRKAGDCCRKRETGRKNTTARVKTYCEPGAVR